MKPSIRAIIWNDWPALASAIGTVMVWLLYFGYPLLKRSLAADPYFSSLIVVSTLVLLGLLSWRILRVLSLFAHGVVVPGRITSIQLVKDRGRIDYAFQFGELALSSWSPVHQTARVLALAPGQSAEVLVNPKKPERSILKALYL